MTTIKLRAEHVEEPSRSRKIVPTLGDLDADDGLVQAERLVHLQQRPRPLEYATGE